MTKKLFLFDIILSRLTRLPKCLLEIIKEYEIIPNGTMYKITYGFDESLALIVGNKLVKDGLLYRLSFIKTQPKEVKYVHYCGQGEIHIATKPIQLTNQFAYFFDHSKTDTKQKQLELCPEGEIELFHFW